MRANEFINSNEVYSGERRSRLKLLETFKKLFSMLTGADWERKALKSFVCLELLYGIEMRE